MKYYIHPQNQYGSIYEYFHFMYGYFLPFVQYTQPSLEDTYFVLNCNNFSKFFKELKTYTIKEIEINKNISDVIDMFKSYIGFDSISCQYKDFDPKLIKEKLYSNIDFISDNRTNKDILLIDRSHPKIIDGDITNKKYFTGAARRSIPNINEIRELLDRKNISYTFCYTENMSLIEQIKLFSSHKLIIAQHGAALGNMIFCDKHTHILEIRPKEKNNEPWYENLAKIIGNKLTVIEQTHSHSPVNTALLEQYL